MLLATPSRYEPGDRLQLSFRVADDQREPALVEGTVVRVLEDPRPDAGWWRRLVAVRFDATMATIEPFLCAEEPRQAALYHS